MSVTVWVGYAAVEWFADVIRWRHLVTNATQDKSYRRRYGGESIVTNGSNVLFAVEPTSACSRSDVSSRRNTSRGAQALWTV